MSTLHKVEKVWLERLEKAVKKPKAEKPFMDLKDLDKITADTYYGDSTRNMMQALKRKSFRIKPEDQEKIANGRNVWLLNALSRRGDTDKGVIHKILANSEGYGNSVPYLKTNGETEYGRSKAGEAKTEMYNNFISQLSDDSRATTMKRLLHGPSHDVQRHVAQHLLTGEELLNHISDREHPMQNGAAQGALKNPNFGPEHTDEIMGHGSPDQVKALISGKRLEPHQYELLFSNPNSEVRDAAIRKVAGTYSSETPNLPAPVVVRAMQEHPDKGIQASLYSRYADKPEVQQAAWNMMPQSKEMTKQIINDHEHFTPQMGQAIMNAHGNDEGVVRDLSNKEDILPTDMVRGILQSPQYSDSVKARWLKHDHLTPQDLLPFAQSNDIDTVRRAMEHPNADESVVRAAHDRAHSKVIGGDQSWENRRWQEIKDKALQHPKAPTDLAGNIAMMSESAQIKAASYAANLSPDQMAKLAASPHVKVREEMAKRKDVPPEIHQTLRNDKQAGVRKAYMWSKMRYGGATSDDWKSFVTDKAGTIRQDALKSRDLPEEAVALAAKHKDEGTRNLAMQHPNVPAALVNQASQDKDPKVRMTAWKSGKLSPESAMNVYRNLGTDEERKEFLMNSSQHGGRGGSRANETRLQVPKEALDDAIARGQGIDAARYAMHSMDPDHVTRAYEQMRDARDWDTANVRNKMIEKAKAVHPQLLDQVLADNNRPAPEGVDKVDWKDNKVPTHAILKRPELSEQHLLQVANTPEPDRNLNYHDWEALAENPKTATLPQVKDFIKHGNIGAYRHFIEKNPGVTEGHLREAYDNPDDDLRHEVIKHAGVPMDIVRQAMRDPHPRVAQTAQNQIALHAPDEYNATLPDAHTVDVHPAVEKLKHLKGLIEEQPGRSIAKRDLKAKLNIQEAPKEVLDPKGNITPESIDTAIKNLPKTRYNISYRHWKGAQMHDSTKPQLVMQMNLTNEQVNHLKSTGLYDTFRKIHDMSYRSGHPVQKHTLGWSRIDTQHPGHIHVDEVQSDLGQGTIRQILKEKESGRMSEGDADKYVKDLKEINKYLAGGHKTINHAILSAVHQTARERGVPAVHTGEDKPHETGGGVEAWRQARQSSEVPAQKEIKSTSMDTLNDQAKQSGQQTGGGKDLPVHMQQTYEEFPKAMGYQEKPKKEVMPATNSKEPTVNYRKLTKSMVEAVAAMAFLAKSGFKNGWASSRPDRPQPAGDMLPSGERHGTSPSVHVRADTMTYMNYDTSEEHAPKDLKKTDEPSDDLKPEIEGVEQARPVKKFGNLRHMIDKAKLLASKQSTHKPEDQPRNEKGQFEAWDEAAAIAHEETPEDYDPYADEEIWGKKEKEPKLKKAIEGLSRLAQKIKAQTEGQVQQHGQIIPTRFPATAKPENLYASYKQNPHNPIASVLKYGIHRIENADRYSTPEGAEQADNEFVKARDHAMTLARIPRDKRGNQHSIQELHNIILKAPHLIDGLIQHQNQIHAHLKGTNKTKMIEGEPHVALVRGLGTGSRQKDPMLASYADTHEQTLGNRVTNMHNHWVPLKNVWYSYDHGPRESHPQRYFPAQDEFLVSPHELKTAMSTDVKKLVPRKPKDPGSAKPATKMPDMPSSVSDTTVRGGP